MATAIRPVGYDDRLSVVEHLDELRSRLIVAVAAFVVAFTVCLVFNHQLLRVVNHPLNVTTQKRTEEGKGILGQIYVLGQAFKQKTASDAQLYRSLESRLTPAQRAQVERTIAEQRQLAAKLKGPNGAQPVTLGPGEPFSATFTVAFYFALLISLPLILYQLYAFVIPAFSPRERSVALPLMLMIPFLFIGGVLFGYFLVLPAAVRFLQNFNSDQFNILLQAKDYYKFAVLTLVASGIVFQVPVAVLLLTRLGIVTPQFLTRNWRYAVVILTIIAVLLPGTDPVSTMIECIPLYLLYALSIVLSRFFKPEPEELEEPEDLLD
ncbi:MAG TPA: twin-arginine translocase subunit TatC [Solirubrobacteraceae bacterium]|nr:twin-arginine translocase subunit TatC [Solirubrobacteraceae bacterium]